jgi:LacI family transcriptional regulator
MPVSPSTRSQPKYVQIVDALTHAIQVGWLKSGERLASDDELAEQYRASRNTVVRALCQLRDAGLVERIQGAGTFVKRGDVSGTLRCLFIGDGRFDFETRDSVFGRLEAALDRRLRAQHDSRLELDRPMTDQVVDHKQAAVRRAIEGGYDGVFFLPLEAHEEAEKLNHYWLDQLDRAGVRPVLLDQDIHPTPVRSGYDLVALDHFNAGLSVGRHLVSRGVSRVLMLVPTLIPHTVGQRIEGVRAALEGRASFQSVSVHWDHSRVSEVIQEHNPDAIIGKDDRMAAAAMRSLYQMDRRVPEQVVVCGFDDAAIAAELPVPLSSYRQPIEEIAEAALGLLVSRIQRPDRPARQVIVSGELVARASTDRPA